MWIKLLVTRFTSFLFCEAFYHPKLPKNLPEVRPKTVDDLKRALLHDIPLKVIIDKVFDFTEVEGSVTELGCFHRNSSECLVKGQQKLNVNDQCAGLTPTRVTYSSAGCWGVTVGSNKVIQGERGGGLKGVGLRLYKAENVEVRNLSITDINLRVIWGGDAVAMDKVRNVLIDGCFFKNIGRQMVATGYGSCTGVTISNSVFDGITPYSDNCKGNHYWLWLFLGEGDMITLQNNVITGTAGRGPKLVASNNSKSLLHVIQNTFYEIVETGLLDIGDNKSSVILEGNVFCDVSKIVSVNLGNIFIPQNAADAEACFPFLGRKCLLNTVVNSGGIQVNNSVQALRDFRSVRKLLTKPVDVKRQIRYSLGDPSLCAKWIPVYDYPPVY